MLSFITKPWIALAVIVIAILIVILAIIHTTKKQREKEKVVEEVLSRYLAKLLEKYAGTSQFLATIRSAWSKKSNGLSFWAYFTESIPNYCCTVEISKYYSTGCLNDLLEDIEAAEKDFIDFLKCILNIIADYHGNSRLIKILQTKMATEDVSGDEPAKTSNTTTPKLFSMWETLRQSVPVCLEHLFDCNVIISARIYG